MERLPLNPDEAETIEEEAACCIQEEPPVALHGSVAEQAAAEQGEAHKKDVAGPPWQQQVTVRGIVVGLLLGSLFCIVVHRMNLGPGIIPSLNIAAGLLGFCAVRTWMAVATAFGLPVTEFGPQENAVVQTFITACSSVAFTGGFSSYLTGLDRQSFDLAGGEAVAGNRPEDVYEPELSRIVPYMVSTSIIGVFFVVLLRKMMIIDYGLVFPSGTATGLMIGSFHTARGGRTAGEQLRHLARWFGLSFAWDLVKFLFSGTACAVCSVLKCGALDAFPLFGMGALKWTFSINLSPNIIGAGMICPHIVNLSMLAGATLAWGVLWPVIATKEGDWYPAGEGSTSFRGMFAYKVFITIAALMGDGTYNLLKVLAQSARHMAQLLRQQQDKGAAGGGSAASASIHATASSRGPAPAASKPSSNSPAAAKRAAGGADAAELAQPLLSPAGDCEDQHHHHDHAHGHGHGPSPLKPGERLGIYGAQDGLVDEKPEQGDGHVHFTESEEEREARTRVFLSDTVPWTVSVGGYCAFGVLGAIIVPMCYPAVRWYHVLVGFALGPILSVANTVGTGLTDWDLSSMYGKIGIFVFAAWVGRSGGVVAGLALCGVIMATTSTVASLMQDFRTGYLSGAAPKAMFSSQLLGAAAGVVLAPLTFMLFWKTGQVGVPGGPYPAPYAVIYRAMAIFATEGASMLPTHCFSFMVTFFLGALVINAVRDAMPHKYARFIPLPMAMAIPFYLGAQLAIDMVIGSLIVYLWERKDATRAKLLAPAVASGLIVGDGVFSIPSALLSMVGVNPPMCLAVGST